MKRDSKYNPIFRKNTLKSLMGDEIIRLIRFYNNEYDLLKPRLKLFENNGTPESTYFRFGSFIRLEFKSGKVLNFHATGRGFRVQNAIVTPEKLRRNIYLPNYISIYFTQQRELLEKDNEIIESRIIGKKIKKISLLKETSFFNKERYVFFKPSYGIWGVTLHFENGKVHFSQDDYVFDEEFLEDEKVNNIIQVTGEPYKKFYGFFKKYKNIRVDFDNELFDKNIFLESQEFYGLNESLNLLIDQTLKLEDALDNSIIDFRITKLASKLTIKVKSKYWQYFEDEIIRIQQLYPKFKISEQLDFFKDLLNQLVTKNHGLLDFVLGLNYEYNFKLIGPLDFVPFSKVPNQVDLLQEIIKIIEYDSTNSFGSINR